MKTTTDSVKKERDLLPDILRGFAIIMVVLGHCIQEGNGADFSNNMLYFDDRFYWFIYSFHMPLFALIAGYFAYPSIRNAEDRGLKWTLLGKRVSTYFIPIFFWTLFEVIREAIINTRLGYITYTPALFLSSLIRRVLTNHWFLWSMSICFVIVWVIHFYLFDNLIIYGLIYLSLFFLTDAYNLHAYKFLLPFYVVAYYVNRMTHEDESSKAKTIVTKSLSFFHNKKAISLAITFIIFTGLFLIYRREALIYVGGYRITKNIWWQMLIIDIYRMIIGFVGSLFWIILFAIIRECFRDYKFPVLTAFGRYSLGVYLISGYTTILIMRRFTDPLLYSIPRVLMETVLISAISIGVSIGISKVPVVRKIIGR